MGLFSGIGNAPIFDRGTYFQPNGKYRLKVVKLLAKDTRNSGLAFIAEFEVLESNHAEDPIGAKRTWFQSLTKKDIGYPAVKEFMMYLLAVERHDKEAFQDFEQNLETILEDATSFEGADSDHPMHGDEICLETVSVLTKDKKDFTRHNWSIAK